MRPELPTQHPEVFRRNRANEHGGTYDRYRYWLETSKSEFLDAPSKYSREQLEGMTTRQLEIVYLEKLYGFLTHEAVLSEIRSGKITLGFIKPHADEAKNLPHGVAEDHNAAHYFIDEVIKQRWIKDGVITTFAVPLSRDQTAYLYKEHENKGFICELLDFAASGPITFILLRDETGRAVERWRDIIGSTDPKQASFNSIRGTYAPDIRNNIMHGSDSILTAEREIAFFADVVHDWLSFLNDDNSS